MPKKEWIDKIKINARNSIIGKLAKSRWIIL